MGAFYSKYLADNSETQGIIAAETEHEPMKLKIQVIDNTCRFKLLFCNQNEQIDLQINESDKRKLMKFQNKCNTILNPSNNLGLGNSQHLLESEFIMNEKYGVDISKLGISSNLKTTTSVDTISKVKYIGRGRDISKYLDNRYFFKGTIKSSNKKRFKCLGILKCPAPNCGLVMRPYYESIKERKRKKMVKLMMVMLIIDHYVHINYVLINLLNLVILNVIFIMYLIKLMMIYHIIQKMLNG